MNGLRINNPVLYLFLSWSLLMVIIVVCGCKHDHGNRSIDLSGNWYFQIDSTDTGINERWFDNDLSDSVHLPGSMLTNSKGDEITVNTRWTGGIWDSLWYRSPEFEKYRQPGNIKVSFWLQPLKHYVGVAWYRKTVEIPDHWQGKNIELFLERCHWETTLWVDTVLIGMQNALGAPHIFDLTKSITPGKHNLTVRIDNRIREIDPGKDAHSISDNTQTNWNGIIGKMILSCRPVVYIDNVQIYPDVDSRLIRLQLEIINLSGREEDCIIYLSALSSGHGKTQRIGKMTQKQMVSADTNYVELTYPMGDAPLEWNEFDPHVYTLKAAIKSDAGTDIRFTDFGMRKFSCDGTRFAVNGHHVFLRGTLECCIFPLTGYPSTDPDDWMRIFNKCKEYGLNHVRFHSWCPPEAAFIAADRLGIYLSVENSAWASVGDGMPIDRFIYEESERIVKNFGNHPSFCMMAYGNEASGKRAPEFLTQFVKYWQAKDDRRVYTSASGFPESPASDYVSSGAARIQWWDAGLSSLINSKPPSSDYDWTVYIDSQKPTVSHEIGQWCVYPDFREMDKYTGVLKPRNFEIFFDKLTEHGMASLADSFLLASGRLQVLCYKADIEAALRTPGFAGFQLLDLHDFPGQGTALVGILNPFWEEKGYTDAKEFTEFCNGTVPLLRLPKMIFLNNETLTAVAEVLHYGRSPLKGAPASWRLTDSEGDTCAAGTFDPVSITNGLGHLGMINQKLDMFTRASQLKITVAVGDHENSWDIWVYPARKPEITGNDQILVTRTMDRASAEFLLNGGKVLLTPKKGSVRPDKGGDVPVGFSTIFWNTQWTAFRQPPFTLGILCDPHHPALSEFPTEYHSNYQWWDAMSHCNAIIIDSVSSGIKPIVRIIDDWVTAKPLALIFECKVGKGSLLVSGIDLIDSSGERSEAAQMLYSLKKYMAGGEFNPVVEVDIDKIESLFR